MTIKQTNLLSKQELNNYINKQSYKSIEVIETCNREGLELLKRETSTNKMTIVVIKR